MKITKRTIKAIASAKSAHVASKTSVKGSTKGAKAQAETNVKVTQKAIQGLMIAALQTEVGSLKDGALCGVKDGRLDTVGTREARGQLGGYVDGGKYGKQVGVSLFDGRSAQTQLRACRFSWAGKGGSDKVAKLGLAIGDSAQKGVLGVVSLRGKDCFAWQVEQDANSANAHERGHVEYCKETGEHKLIRSALGKVATGNVRLAILSGSRGKLTRLVRLAGEAAAK